MNYDKPRIASTVVIGIFLLVGIIFAVIFAPITWKAIQEAIDSSSSSSDPAGQAAGGFVLAIFGGLAVVLVGIVYGAILISSGICLIFAIKNRFSTLKPVRIISYVYDGLAGLLILACIAKILMIFVFQI